MSIICLFSRSLTLSRAVLFLEFLLFCFVSVFDHGAWVGKCGFSLEKHSKLTLIAASLHWLFFLLLLYCSFRHCRANGAGFSYLLLSTLFILSCKVSGVYLAFFFSLPASLAYRSWGEYVTSSRSRAHGAIHAGSLVLPFIFSFFFLLFGLSGGIHACYKGLAQSLFYSRGGLSVQLKAMNVKSCCK